MTNWQTRLGAPIIKRTKKPQHFWGVRHTYIGTHRRPPHQRSSTNDKHLFGVQTNTGTNAYACVLINVMRLLTCVRASWDSGRAHPHIHTQTLGAPAATCKQHAAADCWLAPITHIWHIRTAKEWQRQAKQNVERSEANVRPQSLYVAGVGRRLSTKAHAIYIPYSVVRVTFTSSSIIKLWQAVYIAT